MMAAARTRPATAHPRAQSTSTVAAWQPLGPTSVVTPSYGLVSGRVTSIAFDPADPTGNRVYLGATGGGVWLAQNAATANASSVDFTPLTDTTAAMSNALDASISIGAVSVQPGGTGVVLAGAGDPNDALDSYYSAGILRSTDGGAHWQTLSSNLPETPASSVVVDPLDASTVYLATDAGVFSTRQISTCAATPSNCWAPFGAGLPQAPVVALSAAPPSASVNVLAAATYGRGNWQIPLLTAGTQLTTATITPNSMTFASQSAGSTSAAQTVTLTNTGSIALAPTTLSASGNFAETDNCLNQSIQASGSCTIQVSFTPTQAGTRTGQLTIAANIAGGQLIVALSGSGTAAGTLPLSPVSISFGSVETETTSSPLQVTVQNTGTSAVPVSSVAVTAPFALASNACGASIAASSACQLTVTFAPTQTGPASGTLTLTTSSGAQTVALTGTGAAPPSDTLTPASLSFPGTIIGLTSASAGRAAHQQRRGAAHVHLSRRQLHHRPRPARQRSRHLHLPVR